MEILAREKISQIHLSPGDTLQLTYKDESSGETILAKTILADRHAMIVDEAVLFATVFEGRRALGGMVVERAE